MKSQKQAVIDEVISAYASAQIPFTPGVDVVLTSLPSAALEFVKHAVAQGILNGTIEYSKDLSDVKEVTAYARSMVMNHLKKAKELNGGNKYTPSSTRPSSGSSTTAESSATSTTSNGINKSILTEKLRTFVEQNL